MASAAASAFAVLYEAQYDRIYRLCLGYSGDAAEAADLTQEVFVQAWQGWASFRGDSQPGTWLYRIAVNTCLMARRKRRIPTQPLGPQVPEPADRSEASQREAQVEQLYRHIHALPEADRLLISLVLEQVPYPDIAQALGITENALRVRVHRLKKRLKDAMTHELA